MVKKYKTINVTTDVAISIEYVQGCLNRHSDGYVSKSETIQFLEWHVKNAGNLNLLAIEYADAKRACANRNRANQAGAGDQLEQPGYMEQSTIELQPE